MPKVSVIVPIYNVEKYLPECIESLRRQTLSDIEIILVNDGSPDKCDKICREYARTDKRIKYIDQPNAGVSVARNNGLKIANGSYIFFMDSDDTIDELFLQHAYETATKNNSDVVVLGEYFRSRMPLPPALPIMALFFNHNLTKAHTDILFPAGIQPCEDGLFSNMLLAVAGKISFDGRPHYYYRQHENQNHTQSKKQTDKILAQIPQWLNILDVFYTKNSLFDTHALHLGKFIEHEPFEFRYCKMQFTMEQRQQLFTVLHNYFSANIEKRLSHDEYMQFTKHFRRFLESPNAISFEKYRARQRLIWETKLCLARAIPLRRLRRRTRRRIKEILTNI